MEIQTIIIIVIAIIIGILILKFLSKIAFKVILLILVIALVVYFLLFWQGGQLDLGNKDFIMIELQQKYCQDDKNLAKCKCIIDPVMNDIRQEYSNRELLELQQDKLKSLRVILKSLNEKKDEIRQCLKENDALYVWDDFVDEITKVDIKGKMEELWETLKE